MWAKGFGGWGEGFGAGGLDGFKTNDSWGLQDSEVRVCGWFRGHGAAFRVVA